MKTIFDPTARIELIDRIKTIEAHQIAQWGKMNVYQMVKHCTTWEEWMQGVHNPSYKQEFIGFLFGKIALKRMIKNDNPFDRNVPTSNQFKIVEKDCDLAAEKLKWITLINAYEQYANPSFVHDFFGKMTVEQIGILVYKHSDHHLRQFNC